MIDFQNITKVYANQTVANKNISFQVEMGKTVGLIGPNGCGKTTLLRQLFKILSTTSGKILIDNSEDNLSQLSYVPQFPSIYPALTVKETLYTTLLYQEIKSKNAKRIVDDIIEETDMGAMANQYNYTLSGGQQKLVSFACALAQNKPYLILDEVTSMVDIITKEKIWKIIEKRKDRTGVLMASHDMMEVKRLCDSMVVLKDGMVIFQGDPKMIGNTFCKANIRVANQEIAINLINKSGAEVNLVGEDLYITIPDLDSLLRLVNQISDNTEIYNFTCEHPAFYEEVLEIVKKN